MIWEKVVVSPNGEYVLIKTPVHESVWDVRCVSRDGKILWEKKKVYGNVIISPQEDVIVIVGHIGGIQFCNKNGQVLKKHDLKWQVLIGEPAVFSEDGNYFIIGFSWYNKEKKLAENFLTLFDKAGNMLWKQRLKTTPIKIVVSHQSKKIYIIAREFFVKTNKPRDFIYLFDMNGSLIWEKEMGVYKNVNIALSEDDKFLAVSENPPSRKLKVSLYDNLNGEELWALRFEDDEIIKRRYINPQVSISPQGDFIALLLGHFWARGQGVGEKVILIDRGGKVVFQRDRFDGYIRDVQFSKNGKNLILLGNKHIYFYELNLK
jgi:outer membrane protein assembly factor BamB